MPKQLNQVIKLVKLIPIQTLNATTNGSAVDTHLADGSTFETALVNIEVGELGDQTSTTVKIEESDDQNFASGVQVAEGGDAVTVSANSSYTKQIKRTKRYLRAVVTITGGTSPSAQIFVGAVLWNAEKPFPIIS